MEYIIFIVCWVIAGIVGDLLFHWWLSGKENNTRAEFIEKNGYPKSLLKKTGVLEMVEECPWWGHVIMILMPPTVLLAFSVFDD